MGCPDTQLVPLFSASRDLRRMGAPNTQLVPLFSALWDLRRMGAPDTLLVHPFPTLRGLRRRPNICTTLTADHFPAFTLFLIGQSPTKPGGGGATPTMKIHKASYTTPICVQTKQKREHDKRKTGGDEANAEFFGVMFHFMGLQPLKPCIVGLAANGLPRHSTRSPVLRLVGLTANGRPRHTVRSPVPYPAGLTVPTKHLYDAYRRSFSDAYAVSCRAKPDHAGGVGVQPPQ